jgi:hypothetical protein
MLTLYRFADAGAEYWETWERDDGAHVVHWGKVGKAGDVELVESTAQQSADVIIQKKIDARTAAGFARFPRERIATLWIEYDLLNLGSEKDLKKRLEKRLEELLGWTALGQVDGSKIRSGKLEVRMLVVDADLAARFLAAELAGTDFDDYSWIYEVLPGDGADAASVPLPLGPSMNKTLYRFSDAAKEYWETWEDEPGGYVVHWGVLGTTGKVRTVRSTPAGDARAIVRHEAGELRQQGFAPIPWKRQATLIVEYVLSSWGTVEDNDKRHRLQDRLDETLRSTGLGVCDGGSIGSGTMELCNYVVDYPLARRVIEPDLAGTEFADYSRIYEEERDEEDFEDHEEEKEE